MRLIPVTDAQVIYNNQQKKSFCTIREYFENKKYQLHINDYRQYKIQRSEKYIR